MTPGPTRSQFSERMPEHFEGIITQPLLEKMWKQLLAATEPFYPEVTGRTVRVMQHLHHGGSYSFGPMRAWLLTADGEIPNGARDAIGMCHYSYESALRLSNSFASARDWLPGLLAYVWKGLLDPAVADSTGQLLTTDFFVNGHRIELGTTWRRSLVAMRYLRCRRNRECPIVPASHSWLSVSLLGCQ